eukprot:PhF_6_TR22469/c0_g1_i1/m.31861
MPPKKRTRDDTDHADDIRRFSTVDFQAQLLKSPDLMPTSLTPLEKQIITLKRQHPNTVLLVECGYKMIFYGRDAEIAAKYLRIVCYRRENSCFHTASIPVQRTAHHVGALVRVGLKVGVVKQIETASARAEEGAKGGSVFERSVIGVFTRATWPIYCG